MKGLLVGIRYQCVFLRKVKYELSSKNRLTDIANLFTYKCIKLCLVKLIVYQQNGQFGTEVSDDIYKLVT